MRDPIARERQGNIRFWIFHFEVRLIMTSDSSDDNDSSKCHSWVILVAANSRGIELMARQVFWVTRESLGGLEINGARV